MKTHTIAALAMATLSISSVAVADDNGSIDVAEFDQDGNLILPANFDDWVFLGSSLGQQYEDENFDPDSPGMFQVVRMEPSAYAAFLETGAFADGTMFALHFYGARQKHSINRGGFVMQQLHFGEIHYKDDKYPEGFNFFTFSSGAKTATEVALPNDCVDCHMRDGVYDGVFVQFYPDMHVHLPAEVREWLKKDE